MKILVVELPGLPDSLVDRADFRDRIAVDGDVGRESICTGSIIAPSAPAFRRSSEISSGVSAARDASWLDPLSAGALSA